MHKGIALQTIKNFYGNESKLNYIEHANLCFECEILVLKFSILIKKTMGG